MGTLSNKSVTIKEIAEELGISFSTVSKSLNNHPGVKEETKKAVLQKASELGYSPNIFARGLRTKSAKTIGVIFSDIENPVLTFIFKKISIKMAEFGYTTMVCDSQFDEDIERANILSVLSRSPDFVLLAPAFNKPDNINLLLENTDKVIIFGEPDSKMNGNFVNVDYRYGGYISACELLSRGHRDILIISEPLSYPFGADYVKGIRQAFDEYDICFNDDNLKFAHASIEKACSIILSLWNSSERKFTIPFTAVMGFDDNFAIGVYKAASLLGLSIPDDISVIGFDDNPLSAFTSPPLTTVHLPKEKIASSCIDILTSCLNDGKTTNSIYTLTPFVVQRDSIKQIF